MNSDKTGENSVISYTQQVLDNYPYAAVLLNIIKKHNHPIDFEVIYLNSKYHDLATPVKVFTIGCKFNSCTLHNDEHLNKLRDFLFDDTLQKLPDICWNEKKYCYEKLIIDQETIQLNLLVQEAEFPYHHILSLKKQILYTADYQNDRLLNWQILGDTNTAFGYSNFEIENLPLGWISLALEYDILSLVKLKNAEESKTEDLELFVRSGNKIWFNHLYKFVSENGKLKLYGSLTNIDERKRNDLYLSNLKTAFEQTSSSILITDKKGAIQYVNKKFSDTTGYSLAEVLGKNPRILKTGNTSKQQYRMLWEIILSGKTWRGQFLNRKKNGESYWEKAVIAPVFNDKREIINFVAVKEDITSYKQIEKDRVRIEKALKANEEMFRSLFNLASDPIFISDLRGTLLQCNDIASKLLNIDTKDPSKSKLQDHFLPGNISELLQELQSGDKAKVLKELALAKDGQELIFEFNSSIMNTGENSYVLTIARDVTDRKSAERAILESETKFRLLIENVNAVFWMLDLETMAILYISPNFSKVYGYSIDALLNNDIKNYLSLVHPDDLAFVTRTFKQGLKEDIDQMEFRIIREDGEEQWMQYKSYVIKTPDDKPVQVGLCENVTERMMISNKIQQQNIELNKINKELDQFVYRVSHNLRAPLTSILGIVNLLKALKSEADQSQYIKLIETSILKLDETIHEIIDYSKNSRIDIQSELIDIESLVLETLDSLKFMNEKGKVDVEVINEVVDLVYSDANRIKVLLNNIISNALKYIDETKEKSVVQIRLSILDNKWLSIVVRDNGIGIRKDDTEKIFNMFYRGTDKSFGAGLGLAIVKEVVDKMKGTIQLSSQVYEYTEFNITLPINLN